MIASKQITNTEIFTFIAILVFKLLNRKILFINKKDNRNCYKVEYFLRKQQIIRVNYCKIVNAGNANFLGYFRNMQAIIYQYFLNLRDCTFKDRLKAYFQNMIRCSTLSFEQVILSILNLHLCTFNGFSLVQSKKGISY